MAGEAPKQDVLRPVEFVAYYTGVCGAPYGLAAKKLQDSLLKFDLKSSVHELEDFGSWGKNTLGHKAAYILRMMEEWASRNTDIVYIDADCVVLKPPVELLNCTKDFAAYYWQSGEVAMSGVLFFKNTPQVRQMVKYWAMLCNKPGQIYDHDGLNEALKAHKELTVKRLGWQYWWTPAIMHTPREEAVIEHKMMSRKEG